MTNAGTIPQRVQVRRSAGDRGGTIHRPGAPKVVEGGKLVPVVVSYSRSPAPGKAEGMS